MRCFVITRKHIVAVILAAAVGGFSVIAAKKPFAPAATTAFRNTEPDNAIKDILPVNEEPSLITKVHQYIEDAVRKKPVEILSDYGGIFEDAKTYTYTTQPPQNPEAEATATPLHIVTEEKTSHSSTAIKNDTKYEINIDEFNTIPLSIKNKPEILIIHTHTTECYTPEEQNGLPDNSRSTDETKNMIAVGNVISEELEKMGFAVTHDTTVHDYPSYQGAYGRSLSTAKKNLEQNKNISVILDIHRDAVTKPDGTRVKLTTSAGNKKCAQMMIVCGTDGGGLTHPHWKDNLNFALKIQQKAEEKYSDLMRPINLREERFNHHLTPYSLILEIGTHGNTLSEAKNGAVLLAGIIGEVLNP